MRERKEEGHWISIFCAEKNTPGPSQGLSPWSQPTTPEMSHHYYTRDNPAKGSTDQHASPPVTTRQLSTQTHTQKKKQQVITTVFLQGWGPHSHPVCIFSHREELSSGPSFIHSQLWVMRACLGEAAANKTQSSPSSTARTARWERAVEATRPRGGWQIQAASVLCSSPELGMKKRTDLGDTAHEEGDKNQGQPLHLSL